MPQSNMDDGSQQMDPGLAREIAAKKQYIEQLRNNVRELKQENDMLMQNHYVWKNNSAVWSGETRHLEQLKLKIKNPLLTFFFEFDR